ncbi:ABC transporter substrate-binding protein [Paenibacillus radicis (ex Xue et al. 2023)]|uniref:Sugar ABC transporter substrate-binding protein n=1 Tax=Paenibacillus radicis (ex Xue et al. 2023) TaxID=2972489 RepID=A0ABT1YIE1_9BACL|nr:sugar ABC transporter substrate-binding protein [Paenibacillus radicis (ex Xue et al. 2023)]MCR8632943.1 sugar ABC transporter substrate-binding protein [Paenibacillus radicis (ex Xue et al. 2023)]
MKIKWIAVLPIVVLSFGTMIGCSSGQSTPDTKNKDVNSTEKKPIVIKLHSWYTNEREAINKAVDDFNAKNPSIKLEYEFLTESAIDAMKKLDLLAASGEQLDVFVLNSSSSYTQRIGMGMLEPLDEYMKKEGINYTEEYMLDMKFNGKYYAIPGKYSAKLVLLNKEYLDAAGLPVPTDWTWDDYMDYARKLTKGEGVKKIYGGHFHNTLLNPVLSNQAQENGMYRKDGTPNLDNARTKKSLEMMWKAQQIDKTAMPYADIIAQKLDSRAAYMKGNIAMVFDGSWLVKESGGTAQLPATFKTVYAPYPKFSKDDPSGLTGVNGDFIAVSSKSKHKEEAYKVARYLSTEGLVLQGKEFPAWKKADKSKLVDTVMSNVAQPQFMDKESLLHVLNTFKFAELDMPPSYSAEASKAFNAETEKFLLGVQDLNTTISKGTEALNKIVSANKK